MGVNSNMWVNGVPSAVIRREAMLALGWARCYTQRLAIAGKLVRMMRYFRASVQDVIDCGKVQTMREIRALL